MTQDIASLPLAHKQPLFGTQKTHISHFKLLSRKNDAISPEIFFESTPFEKFNYDRIRSNNQTYKMSDGIENKLTHFQNHAESEVACIYRKPLLRIQNSEVLVENEKVST